eukprot:7780922-Prorocentrum_lima.AAC.1
MAVLGLMKLRGLWQIVHDEDTYSHSDPEAREPSLAVARYLGAACLSCTWPCAASPGHSSNAAAAFEPQT